MPSSRETPYFSWFCEMFATLGVVGVTYDADDLLHQFRQATEFLDTYQAELGIDFSRVAILAASGYGRFAGRTIAEPALSDRLRAAAFLNADPAITRLPNHEVAFFLMYPRDGSSWHRRGAASKLRLERAGMPVRAFDDGPPKGMFALPNEYEDQSMQILTELFDFVLAELAVPTR